MTRRTASGEAHTFSAIGIVLIIAIGGLATSGIGNPWLRLVIMMAIALVLSWPLNKANEAREKQLRQKHGQGQTH